MSRPRPNRQAREVWLGIRACAWSAAQLLLHNGDGWLSVSFHHRAMNAAEVVEYRARRRLDGDVELKCRGCRQGPRVESHAVRTAWPIVIALLFTRYGVRDV